MLRWKLAGAGHELSVSSSTAEAIVSSLGSLCRALGKSAEQNIFGALLLTEAKIFREVRPSTILLFAKSPDGNLLLVVFQDNLKYTLRITNHSDRIARHFSPSPLLSLLPSCHRNMSALVKTEQCSEAAAAAPPLNTTPILLSQRLHYVTALHVKRLLVPLSWPGA